MNQNLSYSSYGSDPRGSGSNSTFRGSQAPGLSFQPAFHNTSTYTSNTTPFNHGSTSSFIPGSSDYKGGGGGGGDSDDRRIAALLDSYFIDTPTGSTNWNQGAQSSSTQLGQHRQQLLAAASGSYGAGNAASHSSAVKTSAAKIMTPEKRDKERVKRLKQAEAARQRYHRLTPEQKKDLNMRRTVSQKRKRQREKELEELEAILRQSNDIQEDPEVTDQLRERRMRAKWAEAARARYQRMSSEERRAHNNKRRMRQMQNAINATKDDVRARALEALQAEGLATGDPAKDEEAIRQHIKDQNNKKAEAARQSTS